MPDAIRSARIVHQLPGRLRMRVPGARRNHALLEQMAGFIRGLGGVERVEINPATGSVLVHYDPGRRDELAAYLPAPPEFGEAAGLAEKVEREAEFLAAHSHAAAAVVQSAHTLDRSVRVATGGLLDLKVLLPAGLAAWAFLAAGAETATPMWLSLGIFSFNSFVALHRPMPVRTAMGNDAAEPSASQ
jgi:hypothetical protein